MHLDVIGAGPAYTDRPGRHRRGVSAARRCDERAPRPRPGIVPAAGGHARSGRPSTRSSSATSIPTTSSTSSPLRHYLRWEKPRRRVRVIGPAGLDDRLDALHDEPGFSAASLDIEPLSEGTFTVGGFEIEAARVTHTRSELRVPCVHAASSSSPASSTRATAVGPRTSMPDPARRHAAVRGLVRSRAGRARRRSTSTGPRSATWRPRARRARAADPSPDGLRPRRHGRQRACALRWARGPGRPRLRDHDPRLNPPARATHEKRPRHPTEKVERPGRTSLGVATHKSRKAKGTSRSRDPGGIRRPAGRWT